MFKTFSGKLKLRLANKKMIETEKLYKCLRIEKKGPCSISESSKFVNEKIEIRGLINIRN